MVEGNGFCGAEASDRLNWATSLFSIVPLKLVGLSDGVLPGNEGWAGAAEIQRERHAGGQESKTKRRVSASVILRSTKAWRRFKNSAYRGRNRNVRACFARSTKKEGGQEKRQLYKQLFSCDE